LPLGATLVAAPELIPGVVTAAFQELHTEAAILEAAFPVVADMERAASLVAVGTGAEGDVRCWS
jgi:hypothetical protein